jgi:hypothetical protein
MNEDYEFYKTLRKDKSQEGKQRREQNVKLFAEARQKAACAGMTLEQHGDVHYALQSPEGWRLNIYPGNLRLYYDRQYNKPPFLKVPPVWNLIEVIDAAIAASQNTEWFEKEIASKVSEITHAQISERAYFLWEAAGRPHGEDQHFWNVAEKELRGL